LAPISTRSAILKAARSLALRVCGSSRKQGKYAAAVMDQKQHVTAGDMIRTNSYIAKTDCHSNSQPDKNFT
jgi:hypothetical protein